MDIKELKFLLKLLGKVDYSAPISEIKPNEETKSAERDKICRQLRDRSLVDCSEEISKIKLTPAGKALLKHEKVQELLTTEEQKIFKACQETTISPSQTKITPAQKRDELIEELISKGFIAATEKKIKKVWLTQRGKEFLAQEYTPDGSGNITITKQMLKDYLHFIRKSLVITSNQTGNVVAKPSDEEILETIVALDQELGTENFLPIFHLRNKLQPPLSREELDQAIYRLQRQDKLEMNSIVETVGYTKEQLQAGIPQEIGSSLFFLIVN